MIFSYNSYIGLEIKRFEIRKLFNTPQLKQETYVIGRSFLCVEYILQCHS